MTMALARQGVLIWSHCVCCGKNVLYQQNVYDCFVVEPERLLPLAFRLLYDQHMCHECMEINGVGCHLCHGVVLVRM